MEQVERLVLLADLPNEFCALSHGPQTREEDFPAENYLIIPVGFNKKK